MSIFVQQLKHPADLPGARRELSVAVVENLPSAERTLLAQMLARSFVDAYITTVAGGRPLHLAETVGRGCAAHGWIAGTVFTVACSTLDIRLTESGFAEEHIAPLRDLSRSLRSGRTAAAIPLRPPDVLDEVDAAINDVVGQLGRSDHYAADQAQNVSAWCSRIARKLDLSPIEVRFAGRSGLIHDIGESTIPAEILQAPRALEAAEMDIVRAHPIAGERMALEHDLLAQFAPAIRSHHERMDGRGYPDGLRGDDIPLVARIVCIADAFNAMIGRRYYREPYRPDLALQELVSSSGTQFDANVVAALREVARRP